MLEKARILPESDFFLSRTIQPVIPVSLLLQHENPSLEMNPVAQAERQVEATLDDLVATLAGALQKKNQMDIKALLNPEA